MLPTFPQFHRLSLTDQTQLEGHIHFHPPHSDFNLASLWSYDTANSIQVSTLHGNLVVIFRDYISGRPLLSFLGTQRIPQTLTALLQYQQGLGNASIISLLSEHIIMNIKNTHDFKITEDRDNFDYIIDLRALSQMGGTAYLKKRTKVHAFERVYGPVITSGPISLTDTHVQTSIVSLFHRWEQQRKKNTRDTQHELTAIGRLLASAEKFSLHGVGIYAKSELIAFAINEVIHDHHGVTHFEKADMNFRGVYEYLKRQIAVQLLSLGCTYLNLEQDLGLEGLRSAKLSYRPVRFMKKFTVSTPPDTHAHPQSHQGSDL